MLLLLTIHDELTSEIYLLIPDFAHSIADYALAVNNKAIKNHVTHSVDGFSHLSSSTLIDFFNVIQLIS